MAHAYKTFGESWKYSPYQWPRFSVEYAGDPFKQYNPTFFYTDGPPEEYVWRGKRGSWFRQPSSFFPNLTGTKWLGPELKSKDAHIHAYIRHRRKTRKRKR